MKLFLLVVLFCILHHIAAQQYYVTDFYTTTSCSGTAAVTVIVNTENKCFAGSNGQNSYSYSCTNNDPTSVTYSGDTQCSGSSSSKTYSANQCNR